MNIEEIVFEVHQDEIDGSYSAQAIGHSIFTEGNSLPELRTMVRDAVGCHFGDAEGRPKIIRLHFVRDEVLAV